MTKNSGIWADIIDEIEPEKNVTEAANENKGIEFSKDAVKDDSAINDNFTSKNARKKNSKNVLDSLPVEKSEHKKFYKGIYFDEDIYNVLSNLVQQKGGGRRNIQSKIVNDCLREALENRKLL